MSLHRASASRDLDPAANEVCPRGRSPRQWMRFAGCAEQRSRAGSSAVPMRVAGALVARDRPFAHDVDTNARVTSVCSADRAERAARRGCPPPRASQSAAAAAMATLRPRGHSHRPGSQPARFRSWTRRCPGSASLLPPQTEALASDLRHLRSRHLCPCCAAWSVCYREVGPT